MQVLYSRLTQLANSISTNIHFEISTNTKTSMNYNHTWLTNMKQNQKQNWLLKKSEKRWESLPVQNWRRDTENCRRPDSLWSGERERERSAKKWRWREQIQIYGGGETGLRNGEKIRERNLPVTSERVMNWWGEYDYGVATRSRTWREMNSKIVTIDNRWVKSNLGA